MATRLSLSNCALSAPQCLMHAGRWLSRSSSSLWKVLFFVLLGDLSPCWVTCHPPHHHRAGGRAGVDTDHSSMRQVVLGYNVTSSRVLNPDLTEKRYWKQKRHWSKGLPSLGPHCPSQMCKFCDWFRWLPCLRFRGIFYSWALTCSKYHMSWMSSSLFLSLSSITNSCRCW